MDAIPNRRSAHGPGGRPKIAAAAVALTLLSAGGCGFEPVREVSPAEIPAAEAPDTLAFVSETEDTEVVAPVNAQPAPTVGNVPAGKWILDTDTARVGVYSAPDTIYTRLGILEPDDLVLSTGKRVDNNGVVWMEIAWGDTTGWVIEVAFTVTPGVDSGG